MFTFVDLFSGIGGMRIPFEELGGKCVFSCEIDKFARQTYQENFGEEPVGDIREVKAQDIPDHNLLLAGFPCPTFSIAGVSKRKSLGMDHGLEDEEKGALFFEVARILETTRPAALLLENVKHLKYHDSGNTLQVILTILDELGYEVFTKILDAQFYVPQHRERIFMVGFSREVYPDPGFEFPLPPKKELSIADILLEDIEDKYTLSDKLWQYLQDYKKKHQRLGHGFGYGLIDPEVDKITRTLSARYYKDGSEILIKQNGKNPRRLTPRECARLMGFSDDFKIPVSDTQAYQQFGNSVAVPVVRAIAEQIHTVMRHGSTHAARGAETHPSERKRLL